MSGPVATGPTSTGFVAVAGGDLEWARWDPAPPGARAGQDAGAPLLLLHEGLGSVGLWRRFPEELARASGRSVVAYSRAGYGRSSPAVLPRRARYMHDEALETLPSVRRALGLDRCVLVGHSDGASISVIHAGVGRWPVEAVVLLAPHLFVEEVTLRSIEQARRTFAEGDLEARMSRHHADARSTFRGWNDVWLAEEFRSWNIEEYLPGIRCRVLVVQGADDPYGTAAQVDAVAAGAAGPVTTCLLDGVGHAPHLEAPETTLAVVATFLRSGEPD
ncbi:MAG TPA: alpha/beta hydrolase [Acidimicrobiales bacterium]|nr:alpha/beta hydrolase [Acidimicrobiales bacterium]